MLTSLLSLGSRWTLVGGKGGVGKTTTAAALAVSLAEAGERVLVLSVDPAHSLGDALGLPLGADAAAVPGVPGLEALEVDAEHERHRFVSSRRGSLLRLLERGTYLDRQDAEGLVDLAVPGMDELAALLRLLELADEPERRVVVDTAPTGHTLRLLELPRLARGWLAALRAMEDKHQAVVSALAGAARPDEVTAMLDELEEELGRLEALLRDPARTRFVLVTDPRPVVLAETRRYRAALEGLGLALGGIVVNRSGGAVRREAQGPGMVFVPPLSPEPRGVDGLRRYAASAGSVAAVREPAAPAAAAPATGAAWSPPTDRALYVVGGKGGVGKSTTAAALAVRLADAGRAPVLLLSTDPAGSLGEVLGREVGAEAVPVAGAAGVLARQLDAPAVWAEFQRQYREEAESLFEGLLSGGLSAGADQAVVERLVELAPPGIDELVALLEVVDLAEDRPYDALVLDTAPTGHLLRLLELPEVALEWTRALLRLLLKYRQVVGLGPLSERVLALSRSLRALGEALRDPRHTWVLAVALPESLSVPETRRLTSRLRELRIEPGALLVNRLLVDGGMRPGSAGTARELLRAAEVEVAVGAPERAEEPVGAEALRELARGWRRLPAGAMDVPDTEAS